MLHRSPSSPRLSCLRHVCSLCAAPSPRYCTLSVRPSQARQSAQDCIRSTVLWSNGGSFEKDFEFAPTKVSVDLFGQALDTSNPSNKRLLRYLAWALCVAFCVRLQSCLRRFLCAAKGKFAQYHIHEFQLNARASATLRGNRRLASTGPRTAVPTRVRTDST
jgi:hypothetical protein